MSPESARGLAEALREFHAELIHMIDGSYEVSIVLDGNDCDTIEVLNVLERHVTERATRARLTLNGREYVMDPEPAT